MNSAHIIVEINSSDNSEALSAYSTFTDVFKPLLTLSNGQSLPTLVLGPRIKSKVWYNQHTCADWRLGPISVMPFDMDEPAAHTGARPRARSFLASQVPVKGKYIGNGVIRIYRDTSELAEEPDELPCDESAVDGEDDDCTVLAVLAVPSYLTASDFTGFVGQAVCKSVSHFRMIRTGVSSRYMVLLKFRDSGAAKRFFGEFNGKPFNSMDPETCQILNVKSIEFRSLGRARHNSEAAIPYLIEDPFTEDKEISDAIVDESVKAGATAAALTKPIPPPTPSLKELPTCPVCLERMDAAVSGLMTILCQHTFHCQCLSKWMDASCPVCRYTSSSAVIAAGGGSTDDAQCAVCSNKNNLWICLICGFVGCGRYDLAHAKDHYIATGHCFSMDMSTQRIWDYSSDCYVHRLIQNQADGKLVELPNGSFSGAEDTGTSKKIEDMSLQYTALLTSQLESQRDYYEGIFAKTADKASEAQERADLANKRVALLEESLSQLQLKDDSLSSNLAEYKKFQAKAEKLQALFTSMQDRYREEQMMNRNVMEKLEKSQALVDSLRRQILEKDGEVADLKEQLRDLMFFLDARNKLEGAEKDVQEGTVSVPSAQKGKKKRR